jgi:hypothetical protein
MGGSPSGWEGQGGPARSKSSAISHASCALIVWSAALRSALQGAGWGERAARLCQSYEQGGRGASVVKLWHNVSQHHNALDDSGAEELTRCDQASACERATQEQRRGGRYGYNQQAQWGSHESERTKLPGAPHAWTSRCHRPYRHRRSAVARPVGQGKSGQVRASQGKSGQVRASQGKSGHVRASQGPHPFARARGGGGGQVAFPSASTSCTSQGRGRA